MSKLRKSIVNHRFVVLGLIVVALLLNQTQVTHAGSMSFISINTASGDCLTVVNISITLQYAATNNDDGVRDWWGLVVSDGAGKEIAYRSLYANVGASGTGTLLIDFPFVFKPGYRPLTVRIYDNALDSSSIADAKSGPLLDTIKFDPAIYGVCTALPLYTPKACPFQDGRLNACDAGQTTAVYCEKDGSIKVLAIYQSKGYDALLVTPAELAQVPEHPATNTVIKTGNGATLYRLTTGELQVNRAEDGTGKLYSFIFKGCAKP